MPRRKKSLGENLVLFLFSLAIMLGGLIPTWFFLGVKYLMQPEGFWQNFVLFGPGVWLVGGFQVIFLAFALAFIIFIWTKS